MAKRYLLNKKLGKIRTSFVDHELMTQTHNSVFVRPDWALSLSLCISISLLRPYTFFSRSPLVFKTLSETTCMQSYQAQTVDSPHLSHTNTLINDDSMHVHNRVPTLSGREWAEKRIVMSSRLSAGKRSTALRMLSANAWKTEKRNFNDRSTEKWKSGFSRNRRK